MAPRRSSANTLVVRLEFNPVADRIWLERAAAHGIQEAADELAEFASR